MIEGIQKDLVFAAREVADLLCPFREPDEQASWRAVHWVVIARALDAERTRCQRIAQREAKNHPDNDEAGTACLQIALAILEGEVDG